MRGSRNTMLAGALVIASVLLAVIGIIVLAGLGDMIGKRGYQVRFAINDGVMGLEAGSRVLVGGRPVGAVEELKFELDENGFARGVLVTIRITRLITLRQGAAALLISPLLGGSGTINFRSVGEGDPLSSSDVIVGRIAPPSLLADAGYGPEQAGQVQSILRRADDLMGKLDQTVTEVRTIAADLSAKWPAWSDRFDAITKDVQATTAKGPALAESANARVEEIRTVLETARGYLDENRQSVKDTVSSFRAIGADGEAFMKRLNTELVDLARSLLEEGNRTLTDAQAAIARVDGLVAEQAPPIRRSMANFRLASDQLTATMLEVRRSPWRLLYRPDKRELEYELLYDAARSYAGAVSDLRSASETIQSLALAGGAGGTASGTGSAPVLTSERLAEARRTLDESFLKYQDAEAEFLRQLMVNAEEP